jgi:hypothetical protein
LKPKPLNASEFFGFPDLSKTGRIEGGKGHDREGGQRVYLVDRAGTGETLISEKDLARAGRDRTAAMARQATKGMDNSKRESFMTGKGRNYYSLNRDSVGEGRIKCNRVFQFLIAPRPEFSANCLPRLARKLKRSKADLI